MKKQIRPWSVAIPFGLMVAAAAALVLLAGPVAVGPAHAASSPCVPPPHSGTIAADQTWCLADGSQHLMVSTVIVAPGVVLTIEPGVTVIANDTNTALDVEGDLEAVGTEAQPIVFTSLADSGPYQWPGITFGGGTGTLHHTIVRYTGVGCYNCPIFHSAGIAAFNVQSGEVTIESSQVITSAGGPNSNHGVYIINSRVTVVDTTFSGIGDDPAQLDYPVYISGPTSEVSLSGLHLVSNIYNQVALDVGAMTGHDFALSAQPEMEGYRLLQGAYGEEFTVPSGITLTVEPGVKVRAGTGRLIVQGHLEAVGSVGEPVIFTSPADGGPAEWSGITFDGGTGTLRHAVVRYAGGRITTCSSGVNSAAISAVNVQAGQVVVEDSQVLDTRSNSNDDHGLCVKDSRVAVSNTLFTGIGNDPNQREFPVLIGGAASEVSLSGLHLVGNIYNEVALDVGAMTGHDFTLSAQPEMEGYRLLQGAYGEEFTVPSGITLTVEPGVKVRAGTGRLIVQGHLEAVGSEGEPVIFTSPADGGPAEWSGITFDGGTGTLRHAVVRYAGGRITTCSSGVNSAAISAVNVQAGQVVVEDSQVLDTRSNSNDDHGLCVKDSRVAVSNTLFTGIGNDPNQREFPVLIGGAASEVSLSGLHLVGNIYNEVALDVGAMTGHDFTLSAQPEMEGYRLLQGAYGEEFTVPSGTAMTVEPGVKIRAGTGRLIVQGALEALGTEEEQVLFTSPADSGPSQWEGIAFDGGTGMLQHAVVRYAGLAAISAVNVQSGEVTLEDSQVIDSAHNYDDSGLYVQDSRVTVTNTLFTGLGNNAGQNESAIHVKGNSDVSLSGCAIEGNVRHGVMVEEAAQVHIADTSIVQNGGYGVWVSGDTAAVTMSGSTVLANTEDGVRNSGNAQVTLGGADGLGNTVLGNGGKGANQLATGTQMVATYNWWGDISGPYHPTLNPDGRGESVSDRVLFDPWAVEWQGEVPEGAHVTLVGSRQVVPGEQATYVAMYVNGREETIENAVLVVYLPPVVSFVDATGGGQYWAERGAVVWKLGNLEPGGSGTAAVQVQYAWGLPVDSEYGAQARLGGTNLPLGVGEVQWYLDFSQVKLLGTTALTDAELAAERLAYPDLDLIYTQAEADGFLPGGAVRLTLDAADPITQVVMLRPAGQEVLYLRRHGDRVLASTLSPTSYAARQAEGGLLYDLQTLYETYWGTWGSGTESTTIGAAFSECRYPNVPATVLDAKIAGLAQVLSSATCYSCLSGGACTQCFATLQAVQPLPEASGAMACAGEVAAAANAQPNWWLVPPNLPYCPDGEYYAVCTHSWWTGKWSATYYPCVDGFVQFKMVWNQEPPYTLGPEECNKYYETCKEGIASEGGLLKDELAGCQCHPVYTPPKGGTSDASPSFFSFSAAPPAVQPAAPPEVTAGLLGCHEEEQEGVSKCPRTKISRPRDPNAKYGLEGDLLVGQSVTYTITYENEGDGRAYGVFVVDQLDPALDLSTLTIYGPGELIAEARTILWTVGELGPKGEPDSSGVVSLTVQLLDDLPTGTAVINQATVFFPTVGEETPTNPVVNVVQPLAAVPQRLETTYMQPVGITLGGRGPEGVALSFEVLTESLNGTLSGTAPDLVYTPAENSTGLDAFTFKVTGAGQESRPATVQVVIDPAGDTMPPAVWWTYPEDGAIDVAVTAQPVFTDDVGPVWAPLPFVQFSEAMDEESITDDVVQMLDGAGQPVPVSVAYDGVTRRAAVYPRRALMGGMTYTLAVAAGVKDLAGNAMPSSYAWSFQTREDHTVYLPLILRTY